MRKFFFASMLGILAIGFLFAGAAQAQYGLEESGKISGYNKSQTVYTMVQTIVNGALASLGFVFFGLVLYAGTRYLMARGREEFVEKAKGTLTAAIFGLALVLMAYAITTFIFTRLQSRVSQADISAEKIPGSGGGNGATCDNKIKDGLETDVDCGGSCNACTRIGSGCNQNKDCGTGTCVGNKCEF